MGGYAGDEPPFGADGDEEDSSSSSSSSFLSSSRESDPSSSSGESPNDSSSSGNSDDSDSDSSSSSRSSFSSRSSTTSVQGAAAIESAVEEANSSEECVYEVDEAVFPDVSKAETRSRAGWQWLCAGWLAGWCFCGCLAETHSQCAVCWTCLFTFFVLLTGLRDESTLLHLLAWMHCMKSDRI